MELIKQKYIDLFGSPEGCSIEQIDSIETILDISIQGSLRRVLEFYSGGSVGYIDIFSFTRDYFPNVIDETVRLRNEINLPHNYIFIAEHSDSLVLIDSKTNEVFWFSSIEIKNFIEQGFVEDMDKWDDFIYFFDELLNNEE